MTVAELIELLMDKSSLDNEVRIIWDGADYYITTSNPDGSWNVCFAVNGD